MDDAERADLVEMIANTRQLLEWVVSDPGSKVPPQLREALQDAWSSKAKNRFIELEKWIASREHDAELDEHGLSGPELRAKLAAFNFYYGEWSNLERKTKRRRFRRLSRSVSTEA